MNLMIKPVSETNETITFSKEAWVAYLEDAADIFSVEKAHALRSALGADEFNRLAYTSEEVARVIDEDVSVVTIWRERAKLTQRALAEQAGISFTYLNEIEAGKKPGSAATLKALAVVLRVPMEHLVS